MSKQGTRVRRIKSSVEKYDKMKDYAIAKLSDRLGRLQENR